MIESDLVREIFTRLGEDRWRELIDALRSHNYNSPISSTDVSESIKIKLDQEIKVGFSHIAGEINGLRQEIRQLNETIKRAVE